MSFGIRPMHEASGSRVGSSRKRVGDPALPGSREPRRSGRGDGSTGGCGLRGGGVEGGGEAKAGCKHRQKTWHVLPQDCVDLLLEHVPRVGLFGSFRLGEVKLERHKRALLCGQIQYPAIRPDDPALSAKFRRRPVRADPIG